jgi:acetyltransferase-like isoleucine patch superfamily enzyme
MSDFDKMLWPDPWLKEYKPNHANPKKKGHGGVIHAYTWIGDDVVIGDNVSVQAFVFIPNGVTIGDNVFLGPRVTFTNDKHPPSPDWSETIVEDNVSIGAGAIILPGITLGKGCKIGAGSVVTKSVPSNEVWCGNPAKPIGAAS